jgi:hypothetical protein
MGGKAYLWLLWRRHEDGSVERAANGGMPLMRR